METTATDSHAILEGAHTTPRPVKPTVNQKPIEFSSVAAGVSFPELGSSLPGFHSQGRHGVTSEFVYGNEEVSCDGIKSMSTQDRQSLETLRSESVSLNAFARLEDVDVLETTNCCCPNKMRHQSISSVIVLGV